MTEQTTNSSTEAHQTANTSTKATGIQNLSDTELARASVACFNELVKRGLTTDSYNRVIKSFLGFVQKTVAMKAAGF